METDELKIEIPAGYVIDESKSTFKKIIFKKKDIKPRSWEEFCKREHCDGHNGYFINNGSCIVPVNWGDIRVDSIEYLNSSRNILPSKELAASFIAMMQLMSLRHDWIHKWSMDNGMTDDWKPDWSDKKRTKYCLIQVENIIRVLYFHIVNHVLSFPTKEMAEDFMNTFKDLLEIAKPLI